VALGRLGGLTIQRIRLMAELKLTQLPRHQMIGRSIFAVLRTENGRRRAHARVVGLACIQKVAWTPFVKFGF
jgi:hypothetical protein